MDQEPSRAGQVLNCNAPSEALPPAGPKFGPVEVLLASNSSQFPVQNSSRRSVSWISPQQHNGTSLSPSFISSAEAIGVSLDPSQPSPGQSSASQPLRTLEGVELTERKVNDCFSRYVSQLTRVPDLNQITGSLNIIIWPFREFLIATSLQTKSTNLLSSFFGLSSMLERENIQKILPS